MQHFSKHLDKYNEILALFALLGNHTFMQIFFIAHYSYNLMHKIHLFHWHLNMN